MVISTEDLIKVMNRNPMHQGRGRLCGRLDIMNRILEIDDCCDEDDLLNGCACQVCKFKANLTKERFDIKKEFALHESKDDNNVKEVVE